MIKTFIKLLGLSEKEIFVYGFLGQKKYFTVSHLARMANLPRTTVAYILNSLRQRGIAERIKINRHKEWRLVSDDKLRSRLKKISLSLANNEEESAAIPGIEILIWQGKDGLKKAYQSILEIGHGERIYFVQGLRSAEIALKSMPTEYFSSLHKALKKGRIILEGVSGKSILSKFQNMNITQLQSHFNRLIISGLIPDEYINFSSDILVAKNKIFIINTEEEKILIIKNITFAKMFISLLKFISANAQTINLNKYIDNLISAETKK